MGVGKSVNDGIRIMISGAAFPRTVNAGIGSRLYHAEGCRGSGERVPRASRTDKRIYEFSLGFNPDEGTQQSGQKEVGFHDFLSWFHTSEAAPKRAASFSGNPERSS